MDIVNLFDQRITKLKEEVSELVGERGISELIISFFN